MKKTTILLIAILIIACKSTIAQTRVPENSSSPIYYNGGKVGIGTPSINNTLQVYAPPTSGISSSGNAFAVGVSDTDRMLFGVNESRNGWIQPRLANLLLCPHSGKVGIGTSSVNNTLQVYAPPTSGISSSGNAFAVGVSDTDRMLFGVNESRDGWIQPRLANLLLCPHGGNLGVGTTSPKYKLDVEGTIRARELKVDMQGADFVFEDDYQLRNLEEVEDFITTNKHLPDVAPATKMQENGVNQSEMNQMFLRKIEELTLYTIQLQKENKYLQHKQKEQSQTINKQQKTIKSLQKLEGRISKLENHR